MKISIRNYDIIDKTNVPDGIEVGTIPRDVGIERIRWNGNNLVDLADLNEMWVEYVNGVFVLHAVRTPHSQLVTMQYQDRKKLWNDAGVFRIKTDEQIAIDLNLEYRRSHYPAISDQIGEIMKYLALKTDLQPELQSLIDEIEAVKTRYLIT